MINEIIPRISVGDIRFDASVEELVALGYQEDIAGFDDILNWHTYRKCADVACYVKEGAITCVVCFAACSFKGANLIGKSVNETIVLLGAPEEIGEEVWVGDNRAQIPYEYFEFGLQVWFENGQVTSVFCNALY